MASTKKRRKRRSKKRSSQRGSGWDFIAKSFNPSGKRRPPGFARAVLTGGLNKFRKNYIRKHGPGSWHWG